MNKTPNRSVSDGRSRGESITLGLDAFAKISAVEGVEVSDRMVEDLRTMDRKQLSDAERTQFITGKYGRPSA